MAAIHAGSILLLDYPISDSCFFESVPCQILILVGLVVSSRCFFLTGIVRVFVRHPLILTDESCIYRQYTGAQSATCINTDVLLILAQQEVVVVESGYVWRFE